MKGSTPDKSTVIPAKAGTQSENTIRPGDSRADNFQQGFSLLEILISLLIITVVTGLAAVSLGPYWQKHQLQQASAQVVEQIQLCRARAIIERKTFQIKIAGQTLYRRHKSGMSWSNWKPNRIDSPAQISMSGTSYFYSKGFASPKTINVIHDEYRQKVVININGRVRVSEVF